MRGWLRARCGAMALAEQLAGLGLDTDFPGLKADVNVRGGGVGVLGRDTPGGG